MIAFKHGRQAAFGGRDQRLLRCPGNLQPRLAAAAVADDHPDRPRIRMRGEARQPLGRDTAVERLVGGVAVELAARSGEERVVRLLGEVNEVAAQVERAVLLLAAVHELGAHPVLGADAERRGARQHAVVPSVDGEPDVRKKISQKAVENISALGGAGAVAALQRSYLSFFKNFGYESIGWSCKLRNGVCLMGGVDDGSGMQYVLIKGGGIPAITVMGYNRYVGWDELLTRVKRVTQGNLKPIVR